MDKKQLVQILYLEARGLNLDPDLLLAICTHESSFDPYRAKTEAGYRWLELPAGFAHTLGITFATEVALQSMSFGLGQVMGATARHFGYKGHLTELAGNPSISAHYGALYLAHCVKLYPKVDDTISAYNAGHPSALGDHYRNQSYVDAVTKFMNDKPWLSF